jgi:hypothetical protein
MKKFLSKEEVIDKLAKIGDIDYQGTDTLCCLENITYKVNYSYVKFNSEYKNSEYETDELENIIKKLTIINDMLYKTSFITTDSFVNEFETDEKEKLLEIVCTDDCIYKGAELKKSDFILEYDFDFGYNWLQYESEFLKRIEDIELEKDLYNICNLNDNLLQYFANFLNIELDIFSNKLLEVNGFTKYNFTDMYRYLNSKEYNKI